MPASRIVARSDYLAATSLVTWLDTPSESRTKYAPAWTPAGFQVV